MATRKLSVLILKEIRALFVALGQPEVWIVFLNFPIHIFQQFQSLKTVKNALLFYVLSCQFLKEDGFLIVKSYS